MGRRAGGFLIDHHMTQLTPDRKLLRRRLGKYGKQNFFALLALEKSDCVGDSAIIFDETEALARQILQEDSCLTVKDLAIDGTDLLALGFPAGKMLGDCLAYLLNQVQDEQLPNSSDALLAAAKVFLVEHI